jgi:hypothetical protein
VAFFAALLVAFGVLLPWIVLAGIVAPVSILLVRRSLRHAVAQGTTSPRVLPSSAARKK